MTSAKILITGANGQLGTTFRKLSAEYPQYDFYFADRNELPLDQVNTIANFFSDKSFTHCINCAAYTAVDKAETDAEMAFKINATAVGELARVCAKKEIVFIHISTDYVFDGSSARPYREEDATGPINTYGASKLEGEQLALENNKNSIIIRTAWVYSPFGQNFVKTMIRLMNERTELKIINDQHGSPTYTFDLAKTILFMISSDVKAPGIYHFSNEGEITWYEFAVAIKEHIRSGCLLFPIPTTQYPTPAKRPQYSLLDKAKIRETFGVEVAPWQQGLAACVEELLGKQ